MNLRPKSAMNMKNFTPIMLAAFLGFQSFIFAQKTDISA
jgi:hypothetical protein